MDSPLQPVRPPRARSWWRGVLILVIVLALLGAGFWWLSSRGYHLVARYPTTKFLPTMFQRQDGVITIGERRLAGYIEAKYYAWDGRQRWTMKLPTDGTGDAERLAVIPAGAMASGMGGSEDYEPQALSSERAASIAFSPSGHVAAAVMADKQLLRIATWKDGKRIGTATLPNNFPWKVTDHKRGQLGIMAQDNGRSYCWTFHAKNLYIATSEGDQVRATGQYQSHLTKIFTSMSLSPDGRTLLLNTNTDSPEFEYVTLALDGSRITLQYRYTAPGFPRLFPRGVVYTMDGTRYTEQGFIGKPGSWQFDTDTLFSGGDIYTQFTPQADGLVQVQKEQCRILVPSTDKSWAVKPGDRPVLLSANGNAALTVPMDMWSGHAGKPNPLIAFLSRFSWFQRLFPQYGQDNMAATFKLYDAPGRVSGTFSVNQNAGTHIRIGGQHIYNPGGVVLLSPDGRYLLLTGTTSPKSTITECFIFKHGG